MISVLNIACRSRINVRDVYAGIAVDYKGGFLQARGNAAGNNKYAERLGKSLFICVLYVGKVVVN